MHLQLTINEQTIQTQADPGESLLALLRRLGYFGVKHGCETGECGACAVLLDGKPVNSCVLLAAQAEGHTIQTIESLGEHPEQGWKTTAGLHPLQQAFVESGAIQCGYCTPAQILAAKRAARAQPQPQRSRGSRGALRCAVPLHRLPEAGAGCAARRRSAARRER